jgi:hypothetical protein
VKYITFELLKDQQSFKVPYLHSIREPFLEALIDQFKKYFPPGQLDNFKVFLAGNIPENEAMSRSYGHNEVRSLSTYFKWGECDELLEDWANLMNSVIQSSIFCTVNRQVNKSFEFWSLLLKSAEIVWTERTKKVIHTVLVIPVGSAEAERGFSIMNHVRGDGRRARLGPELLNEVVSIRINGAKEVNKFAAPQYARLWVKDNHMRTDNPVQQRTAKEKLERDPTEFPLF